MPYQRRTVNRWGQVEIPDGPVDQDALEDDEEEMNMDDEDDEDDDEDEDEDEDPEELKRKARLKSRPGPMDISGYRVNIKRKK